MPESVGTWLRKGVSLFFEYDTPRIVHIKSKRVGVTSRIVQALIVSYIIGYVIIYERGYQEFCTVESAVTSKLKGIAFTNFTDKQLHAVPPDWRHLYNRIWDVTDYVVPPTQTNAFFVMTNVIITPNQTLGTCPEDLHIHGAKECNPTSPETTCPLGEALPMGHGVNTGRCVPAAFQSSHHNGSQGNGLRYSCEIYAWCPVEKDVMPLGSGQALLAAAENFTVLIKNQIEFPLYAKRRSNILASSNQTYLASCLYSTETDPFCPVFRLRDIVRMAGEDFGTIAVEGAIISIGIEWNCDLDYDFMTYCQPKYKFRRLDRPDAKIAPGWNFRHSHYFTNDKRTLFKSYGILFVIDVQGRAGKFSFIPFFITLGAGMALLGIATVICDIIVLYLMKDRLLFRDKKYLMVRGSDAFNVYRQTSTDDLLEEVDHDQDEGPN